MLGRADRPTWRLLAIAVAGFCLLVLPPASGADQAPTVSGLQADDAALAAKSRSAILDLYALDSELSAAQTRLGSLQAALHQLRVERASVASQLRLARLDARISQDRLATRLRFLYDRGSVSTLEVLFGAKSLDDALTRLDDVDRVATANQDVLLQVQSARGHLQSLSHRLVSREQTLSATTRAAAATATQLDQTRVARSAYIADLEHRRALDSTQIARLDAQAQAAQAASRRLTESTAPAQATPAEPAPGLAAATFAPEAPRPVAAIGPGGRTLTVLATGYDLSGTTSTGLPVGWGIAAVDPSVIPLGTHLTIPGYGEAVAADTGSAVRGPTIDLWFPTAARAYAWGRRSVTIAID